MSYTVDEAANVIKLAVAATPYALVLDKDRFPDLLFHYTNAKGLHGILSSRTLSATGFQFLNDTSEHIYGQARVLECLRGRNDKCSEFLRELWPKIGGALAEQFPHYVASTSVEGNSISQWRAYGDLHDGYAIAFRRAGLKKADLRLLPLLYSAPSQAKYLGGILDASADAYLGVEAGGQQAVLKEACRALQFAIYSLKDPSFKDEHEWRAVAYKWSSTAEKFRVIGGQIVPCVAIPLEGTDIDHIVQGPGNYRSASADAIERFASACGFKGLKLKISSVPLG